MLSWLASSPGRARALAWVAAAALLPALAAAQPAGGPARAAAEPDPEIARVTAPVVVDGATLFRVRGSSALPAEERAGRIAARVIELARTAAIAPEAVEAKPADGLFNVAAGERVLMVATEADARAEGIELPVVARMYAERIQRAVRAYRDARRPAVLLDGARRAGAATAVAAAALLALLWLFGRLRARLYRRYQERIHSVQFQSFEILRAQRIRDGIEAVIRFVRLAASAALAYFWLHFVLSSFPVTRPLAVRLLALVLEPLSVLGGGLLAQLPSLAFLLVLYFVTRWLLGLMRLFFDAVAKGSVALSGFEPEWALPTYRILRLVVVGPRPRRRLPLHPGLPVGRLPGHLDLPRGRCSRSGRPRSSRTASPGTR